MCRDNSAIWENGKENSVNENSRHQADDARGDTDVTQIGTAALTVSTKKLNAYS